MDPLPKQSPQQNVQKNRAENDTDSSFLSLYRVPLIITAIMVLGILVGGIIVGLRNRGRAA